MLTWKIINLKLALGSSSCPKIIRVLQGAAVRANKVKWERNEGEVIETPVVPSAAPSIPVNTSLLSVAISQWIEEKKRTCWERKTADDHRIWADRFVVVVGDKPLEAYAKADARTFKEELPVTGLVRPNSRR